jgi:hypothetical protein
MGVWQAAEGAPARCGFPSRGGRAAFHHGGQAAGMTEGRGDGGCAGVTGGVADLGSCFPPWRIGGGNALVAEFEAGEAADAGG